MAIAGVALETITSASIADITSLQSVLICTKGLCQVKITNNFDVSAFTHTTPQINYMGRPCILNTDGYAFNTAEQLAPNSNYIELGTFMETGNNVASADEFVFINLNPIFHEAI